MGWKSTIDLTRKEAEEILLAYLEDLSSVSNDDLAEAIEAIKGGENHGHNYRIIEDNCNGRL